MRFHLVALAVPLLLLGCGGARARDRSNRPLPPSRVQADLNCPAVTIRPTGAGGYQASGCGFRQAYVCDRTVCAREGAMVPFDDGTTVSGGRVSEGNGLRCEALGAARRDATQTCAILILHAADLRRCGVTSFTASVAPDGTTTVLAAAPLEARSCTASGLRQMRGAQTEQGFTLQVDLSQAVGSQ